MIDLNLIDALLRGMELRLPDYETAVPIDFVVTSDRATLAFSLDWWERGITLGSTLVVIDSLPRLLDPSADLWTFDHEGGYLLAPSSDEDQASALANARLRADFGRPAYLVALQRIADDEPEFDFLPWIAATLSREPVTVSSLSRGETSEREIGRILLRDGLGVVVDALVIDERGHAAVADENGQLAHFAEQWVSFAEGERPSLSAYLQWLADQAIYGGRVLDGAAVTSIAGDVQDIVLSLASDRL